MTFADELRSGKRPGLTKEEIAGRQYQLNLHVKAVLEGLKQLGFKASVKKVDVQFYKETEGFLGRKKLEKDSTDTTLRIDFSW